MKTKIPTTLALACSLALPLHAQESAKDEWFCRNLDEWAEEQLTAFGGEVVLNNFSFTEKNSFVTDLRVLEVGFSVRNKLDDAFRMNTQVAGYSDEFELVFAMSVKPLFDMVKAGTETITGDIYVAQPVLGRTQTVCLQFILDN